ncbi:GGDEF domain-containing protein [Roseateles sp. DC23W]|uniref:diguanylate cyclase n=1 Tax=Pelomonas dachongensis TaxID=3299029 RepID=A0ABW7ELU0_9BURK
MPAPTDDADVQRIAFAQCVAVQQRTLLTAPLGWALVAWLCWSAVPRDRLLGWLALVLCGWLVCLLLIALIRHQGADIARHARPLLAVPVLEGVCWGAMGPCLMGGDAILNVSLGAILCGVAAINAPLYVVRMQLYFCLCGALWLTLLTGLLRTPAPAQAHLVMPGLALFLALLSFYMHGIGQRVMEGIRLQLANTRLTVQLSEALAAMEHQAATDALTGLPNRRSLDRALAAQLALAEREHRPFTLLMLDLDHFKAVNDTRGHAVGDAVLKAFAQRVQGQLRPSDLCARYGGEEFVVLLSGTAGLLAIDAAERLRRAVADAPLGPGVAITVSVGIATWQAGDDATALLARADAAMYAAKQAGRNRVIAG